MMSANPRVTRLLSADPGNTSRVLRHRVPLAEAIEKEALGLWERVYDTHTGDLRAFRMTVRKEDDSALPSQATPAAISGPSRKDTPQKVSEMELIAGTAFKYGRSITMRLTEADRLSREKNGRLPEDRIERVLAKLFVWPGVGAAQGDILRVWPK